MAAVGAEQLTAVGDGSGHTETVDFTVPALVPSITLAPATGPGGTEVEVSGGGFFPRETVGLRAAGRPLTTVAADDHGGVVAPPPPPRGPGKKGRGASTPAAPGPAP